MDIVKPRFSCPLSGFQKLTAGKHKLRILWALRKRPLWFGELKRESSIFSEYPMAARVLSRELKSLEGYGFLEKRELPGKVRKVEYRLSPLGTRMLPLLGGICEWALDNFDIPPQPEVAGECAV